MNDFWKIIETNDVLIEDMFWKKNAKNWMISKRSIQNNLATFCFSGTGTYYAEGKEFSVKPGRIIIISHDVEHSASEDKNDPIHVIAFRFSLSNDIMPKGAFCIDLKNDEIVIDVLKQMYKYRIRHNANQSIINSYSKALFSMIYINKELIKKEDYDPFMEEVNNSIEEKIQSSKEIPLDDFISKSGSKYLFLKNFKRYNKTTYKNYIFIRKLEYSKFLLIESDLSIKEISSKIGYSDPYIFSNQFKSLYEISPKYYRNKN